MRYTALFLVLAAALLPAIASGCQSCASDPLHGQGVIIASGNKGAGEEQHPQAPLSSQPAVSETQTKERHETVTEANSVFSIGVPPGFKEERRVTTQQPVNFWFEYLSPDMSLTLNGVPMQIPVQYGTGKVAYTAGVTSFSYVMKNNTTQYLSYNLRIVPSVPGAQVPMVTKETWTGP